MLIGSGRCMVFIWLRASVKRAERHVLCAADYRESAGAREVT